MRAEPQYSSTNESGEHNTNYDSVTVRKGADFQGKWRAVAITGADAHAAALGMTGDLKKQYLDGALKETFDVERLVNGCFKIKTDSPFVPGGVMVMKSGESICVDLPGMGKTEVGRARAGE